MSLVALVLRLSIDTLEQGVEGQKDVCACVSVW